MTFTLDWSAIRPLNGGRDKGFEELCAQLARCESPPAAAFNRKGTPDAGVECYATLPDGSEWAWQSKYFDALGDAQWSQIDKSVTTALEKHPRLKRYFVCVPLDRPDARLPKQTSAKEKWDAHAVEWTKAATARGMTVDFVYWGSSELIERLSRTEHVGRVRFWFDVRGFDAAWFNARLDEALRTAGPRYTPEVHVELPIAQEFDAFGRTDAFFERVKGHARTIRERLRDSERGDARGGVDATLPTASTLSAKVQQILLALGAVEASPSGPLSLKAISDEIHAAETAAEELSRVLVQLERDFEERREREPTPTSPRSSNRNPFHERSFQVSRLVSELEVTRRALLHADSLGNNSLMIMRGDAGTGKTHLLCDVARKRINEGKPTVLLPGQRFVSSEAPWIQALQHLDLSDCSAEKFIGALEAAAQAAGSRALLMVDAVNEGKGIEIWPSHLESFLAHAGRSAWVGVVLAVRSSYEEAVISEAARARAAIVTHWGFDEHEYDATKTFFLHYGLELPSIPLLAPEFRNPLFLKTLCLGLNARGETRLPSGLHGITAVFELYLSSTNVRLARSLGFDPRAALVVDALNALAGAVADIGKSWLPVSKAKQLVDALLPNRDFERSLYRGLVVEGILVEERSRRGEGDHEDFVFMAYERFGDHLVAKTLIEGSLDVNEPASAFSPSGGLARICDATKPISAGLLEALCIQIPERTGKELVTLAPACLKQWGIGEAFRRSVIWRARTAFTEDTRDVMNKLCRNEYDALDTLDVLLTVAIVPEHPFNAQFLDQRLRKDTMADRDAWWSTCLHKAWGSRGAIDRLVEWASSLRRESVVDEEALDLGAIALAWTLTTSNRFLRDRATKALVACLTGRIAAVGKLVARFADVDDPYVVERVYCVAYGVAMKSQDAGAIGTLAELVHSKVFASGYPAPQILLRDYARGVVERAIHLGANLAVSPADVRPPYKSTWPSIPTDDDIKALLPPASTGSHASGEPEWGRNRIIHSVMGDDFARYVIGTNSSSHSSDWLSLALDAPRLQKPVSPKKRLAALIGEFSEEERRAWDAFDSAEKAHAFGTSSVLSSWFKERTDEEMEDRAAINRALDAELEKGRPPALVRLEEEMNVALAALEAVLAPERQAALSEIWDAEAAGEPPRAPRFDLREMQRYIVKRVFDLGWTEARFGHFDRLSIGYHGRGASKAERIGKKYQWIAYREILALISDHFQYQKEFHDEQGEQVYEGPWQDYLRDIDPSCPIGAARGGTSRDGHVTAWWETSKYDAWGDASRARDWVVKTDDLPSVEDLLVVTRPSDGSRWLNVEAYFNWQQPVPPDRERNDVEQREAWYICTGYLIRSDDAPAFIAWARGVDFGGRWMPDAPEIHRMFIGEHAWAPASHYFQKPNYGDDGWTQPEQGCTVKIRSAAVEYVSEGNGLDCSLDDGFRIRLPARDLVEGLGIRWSGDGGDFVDTKGHVAACDPTVHSAGPSGLLLREDLLLEFLAREKLTVCWAILGEKRVLAPGFASGPHHAALRVSGAYVLDGGGLTGFIKHFVEDVDG